jgi:hypothetical protein
VIRQHLADADRRAYDRLSDLLGPIGQEALDALADRIWNAGRLDLANRVQRAAETESREASR